MFLEEPRAYCVQGLLNFRWNVLYCRSKQMAYKFICVLLSLSRYKNTHKQLIGIL